MRKPVACPLFSRLEVMGRQDAQAGRPAQWGGIHAALLDTIGGRDDFTQDMAAHAYSFYRKGYRSGMAGSIPALTVGRC